jgi:hypothetical protein
LCGYIWPSTRYQNDMEGPDFVLLAGAPVSLLGVPRPPRAKFSLRHSTVALPFHDPAYTCPGL